MGRACPGPYIDVSVGEGQAPPGLYIVREEKNGPAGGSRGGGQAAQTEKKKRRAGIRAGRPAGPPAAEPGPATL